MSDMVPMSVTPNNLADDNHMSLRCGGGILVYAKIGNLRSINQAAGYHSGNRAIEIVHELVNQSCGSYYCNDRQVGHAPICLFDGADLESVIVRMQGIARKAAMQQPHIELHFGYVPYQKDLLERDLMALVVKAERSAWLAKCDGVTHCTGTQNEVASNAFCYRGIARLIADERLVMVYQPILNIHSGERSCCEALLRITSDDGELIPPNTVLQAAEVSHDICGIDRWVFGNVIDSMVSNTVGGDVSINMSAITLGSESVVKSICELIQSSGCAERIIVEVTETAMMVNYDVIKQGVNALKTIGVRIAIDDFGTGFSSFRNVIDLPVDVIKVDGSFITGIECDRKKHALVSGLRMIAADMDIKIVAERIENQAQLDICRTIGIDYGQGYYLAVPS